VPDSHQGWQVMGSMAVSLMLGTIPLVMDGSQNT